MDHSGQLYQTTVKSNYAALKALYLTSRPLKDGVLDFGKKSVYVKGVDGFTAQGTLSRNGLLGGMSKLYQQFGLKPGDIIRFQVRSEENGQIIIFELPDQRLGGGDDVPETAVGSLDDGVFARLGLKDVPIEAFRIDRLHQSPPHDPERVLMAFIALSLHTNFRFCQKLGPDFAEKLQFSSRGTLPTAVCIEEQTGRKCVMTCTVRSSDFAPTYDRSESDVLVCWIDDEKDRALLPGHVIALRSLVAAHKFSNDPFSL